MILDAKQQAVLHTTHQNQRFDDYKNLCFKWIVWLSISIADCHKHCTAEAQSVYYLTRVNTKYNFMGISHYC